MRDQSARWRLYESTLDELAGERAHSLGRAGTRLTEALATYRALTEQGGTEEQLDAALHRARDAAWALTVQRECAGLRSRDFGWMKEHWDVPEEVLRLI